MSSLGTALLTSPLPAGEFGGRYRGRQGDLELELRIDRSPEGPCVVSGDVFHVSTAAKTYEGSFMADKLTVTATPQGLSLQGRARSTSPAGGLEVTLTIGTPPAAVLARFRGPLGLGGLEFECRFESRFFRRVELEIAAVAGVTPFRTHDTGAAKPCVGTPRELGVATAFAEAGVEIVCDDDVDVIDASEAGDGIWSNRELHEAMTTHFRSIAEEPEGWRVWLLAATCHERNLFGVMFDQLGPQRQGCAVFHRSLGSGSPEATRLQLFTYLHELGHCFNLCHSYERDRMIPARPIRHDALSWMNNPSNFVVAPNATGPTEFWRRFPFQFDEVDLAHLRHGFLRDVVMGGSAFSGGTEDADAALFADPIAGQFDLSLELQAARTYCLGEPVVVELKLSSTSEEPRRVNVRLHPDAGFVHIAIQKPSGQRVLYRPFVQECGEPEFRYLKPATPATYCSAYIGYGRSGLYFDQPGTYRLRAVYLSADGSRVVSNRIRLRVDPPRDSREADMADLLLGDHHGQLFSLHGSEAEVLRSAIDDLDELVARHGGHSVAVYAQLARGITKARDHKVIDGAVNRIRMRKADRRGAAALLSQVVATSIAANPTAQPLPRSGIGNVALSRVMERLATTYLQAGDLPSARYTAAQLMNHFAQPSIPAFVQAELRRRGGRIIAVADQAEGKVRSDRQGGGKRRGTGQVRRGAKTAR